MPSKLHTETWLAALLLGFAVPTAARTPVAAAPVYREGELLVEYRHHADAPEARALKQRLGLVPARSLMQGRVELLSLPRVTTTAATLALLRAEPAVARAEPNFRRYARTAPPVPNDPLFDDQWGLYNHGQPNFISGGPAGVAGGDLNLLPAWDPAGTGAFNRTGDPSVVVAVIDDAIQISHPDLAANIVSPHNLIACQNANDPSPVGGSGEHGTWVSGCIAGIGNNGIGVAGVAWHASLMPIKFGFDSATHLQALDWARDHGAKVINASFGGPSFSQIERDAIAALASNDILYVAAAGNEDSNTDVAQLSYPANYDADNIVAVAATNRQDNIASFSQYGPTTVDVAAPGLQVVTTAIGGTYATAPGVSGTSFSAPYVSGVAALVRSHASPAPTYRDVKARLIESGSAVSGANPKVRTSGGRVDAAKAIDLVPGPSLVIKAVSFDDTASGNGNHTLDPGETLDAVFTIRNVWQDASGVTATLTADNGITTPASAVNVGTLAADGVFDAHFAITVPSGITDHRYVTFTLDLADGGGYHATRSYLAEIGALTLGTPVSQAFTSDTNPYDEFHAWHVDVPPFAGPATQTLVVRTSTAGPDIDILEKAGTPPQYNITIGIDPEFTFGFFCTSGVTSDCRDPATQVSGRQDGNEAITIENAPSGTYHFVVVNFDKQAVTYTLNATLVTGDLRPNAFAFTPVTGAPLNTNVISNPITVSGIDTPTFITVFGGSYSINGGGFVSSEGTVSNGQSVRVRLNSGSTNGGFARMQLTIGGVTAEFVVNPPSAPPNDSPNDSCPSGGGGGGGGLGGGLQLSPNAGGGSLDPGALIALLLSFAIRRRLRA